MKDKTYDEVAAEVNKSYKTTNNIKKTMTETGQDFSIVIECLGFKDYYDFVEDDD